MGTGMWGRRNREGERKGREREGGRGGEAERDIERTYTFAHNK